MTTPIALGILLLLSPQAKPGPAPAPAPAPAVAPTFEALWSGFVAADAAGDADAAERALREIRRTRIERNVESLDILGLGLVERGVAKLEAGQSQEAEDTFRAAVALAPGLPDGHAGLAVALLKKGPLGVVASIEAAVSSVSSFLPTGRGGGRRHGLRLRGEEQHDAEGDRNGHAPPARVFST